MQTIILEKINDLSYQISYCENDKHLGEFILDVDGFWYYVPSEGHGWWSDYLLIEIGESLKELNRPYAEHIENYFKQQEGLEDDSEVEPSAFEEDDFTLPLGYKGFRGSAEYDDVVGGTVVDHVVDG